MKVMVSMGNLLLDHPDLSHEEFFGIVDNIKSQNIEEIIFPNQKNTNLVIDLVNKYKQRENK
jgi:hypothetical protein